MKTGENEIVSAATHWQCIDASYLPAITLTTQCIHVSYGYVAIAIECYAISIPPALEERIPEKK